MRVPHRGAHVPVAQQLLNRPDVVPGRQQVRRTTVPQGMTTRPPADPRPPDRLDHGDVDLAALRDRQLAMAMRTIAAPQVQAGPAAPQFLRPRLIGTGTEVDPVVTSEWTFATMDDALKAANGRLARVANIPVRLVRIHPSAVGGRPTFLIRQELADGRFVWVVEGLEGDIAPVEQLLQASGIAMSAATRTRPDYVGTGAQTTITVRMVRVVGYLPVDSLNVLAQKLVVR